MKKKNKLGKFVLGSAAVAGIAVGAYHLFKNYIKDDDDFDDFEDDFDDEFFDDITSDDFEVDEPSREYVSININGADEEATEDKSDVMMDVQEVSPGENETVEEDEATEEDVDAAPAVDDSEDKDKDDLAK